MTTAPPLIDLHTVVDPRGQVTATIPVAWCNEDPLLDKVKQAGFSNPYLFLVVQHMRETKEYGHPITVTDVTEVHVVPLTSQLRYVNFAKPGRNIVRAVVIDIPNKLAGKRVKSLRNYADYANPFDESGKPVGTIWNGIPVLEGSEAALTDINVSADMFAPEPAEWRKKLVRVIFRRREQDQCHFRRRFLFSLLLVPLFAVGLTIIKFALTIFGLLYGARHFDWRFWHPRHTFDDPMNVLPDGKVTSYWYHDSEGYPRSPLFWIISPPVLIFAPLIAWGFFHIQEHHGQSHRTFPIVQWGFWETVGVVDGVAIGFVSAVLLILGVGAGIAWLLSNVGVDSPFDIANDFFTTQWQAYQHRKTEARKARIYADLETMQCGEDPPPLTVGDLPADKQTIELRFHALKTRVCKPFAK